MEPKNQGFRHGSSRYGQKSQDMALIGAAFVILTMGFFIAWGTYLVIYPNQWIMRGLTSNGLVHAAISWYVAFIVGAVVAAFIVPKCQKVGIYYVSAILTIIAGALMIPLWSTIAPVIAARYIAGFAHGLILLTAIVHSSEVAISKYRGRVLGSISFYLATSLFIGFMLIGLIQYLNSTDFYGDQLLGILTVCYGVIALILNRFTFVESPIFHLQNNNNGAALTSLAKLRKDVVTSWGVNQELAEMLNYVDDQRSESICIFGGGNLRPLFRATMIRGLYSASTAVVFYVFAYLFLLADLSMFGLGVVSTARFVSECVGIYIVDRAGRRLMLLLSMGISGVFLCIIGCLFFSTYDYPLLITSGILFITQSFFLGLGLAPISVVFMGESFSLKKKPLSILFVLFVEQAVQILVFILYRFVIIRPEPLFIIVGCLQAGFAVLIYLTLTETKCLSLKDSKDALK